MIKKPVYTTIDDQIALLKSKELIFEDIDFAKEQLKKFGYYNIINSYKAPYLKEIDGNKIFKSGTSFEQIFSLFTLDHNLRNSIMSAMLALEEHIKAAAAEVISSSFGTDQNDYLQWKNYRDRRVSHKRFGLNATLENLKKALMSDKDPIRYYRENYGIIPPWILFKGTYFSTMVNFIRLFKEPQKQQFVQLLYECSSSLCREKDVKTLLFSTLSLCLEYRNLAAHGGRVYDYISDIKIQLDNPSIIDPLNTFNLDFSTQYGLCLLLNLLEMLPYKQPHSIIDNALRIELNRHLDLYECDLDILGSTLNLIIFSDQDDVIIVDGKEYPVVSRRQSGNPGLIMMDMPDELNDLLECQRRELT